MVPTFTVKVEGLKAMLAIVTTLLAVPVGLPGVAVFDDLLQEMFKIVKKDAMIINKKMLFRFILWVLNLIIQIYLVVFIESYFLNNKKHRAGLINHSNFFARNQKGRGIHRPDLR